MGWGSNCFFCWKFLNKVIVDSVECLKWFVVGFVVYDSFIRVEFVFWFIFISSFVFLFYFVWGGVECVNLMIIRI